MDGNNNENGEEPLASPIIMQTHAYFMSSPTAATADAVDQHDEHQHQDDDQQTEHQVEEEVESPDDDQQEGVLSMLAFEAETLSPPQPPPVAADTEEGTAPSDDNDTVPAIEQSGTSATEGTEDYSNPSSPASPSTPTRGIQQRPASTPAGPAERTRRDDKLSALYTPVKGSGGGGDIMEVSMVLNGEQDDFLENESGHEKRKLPCNWVAWVALVVFLGGVLVITTGVVVHNKKQAAAAASLHQDGDKDQLDVNVGQPTHTPTSSPSAKATGSADENDVLPEPLDDPVLMDPSDDGGAITEVEPTETVSMTMDDNIHLTTGIATTFEREPPSLPETHKDLTTDITTTGTIQREPSSLPETSSPAITLGNDPTISTPSPSQGPTVAPTASPIPEEKDAEQSSQPEEISTSVTVTRGKITYRPGDLTVSMNGLLLSTGLTAKMIAKSGNPVMYSNGKTSDSDFHEVPDFGGVFPAPNGGWYYVSNSEVDKGKGGVGAITFDNKGRVIHYKMLLKGTSMNCGGGRTPWDTWISCEELNNEGQVYEVDPTGKTKPKKTVLGGQGGRFESFSYDIRNKDYPRFFVTEDKFNGAIRRFTPHPSEINWDKPSDMLYGKGTMEYLVLLPDKGVNATKGQGTFTWTKHLKVGRESAMELFPNVEGIDVAGGELFFVSKRLQEMTILDLDTSRYRTISTVRGLFDGKPDQITRITHGEGLLFFTEEGGEDAGVHARDSQGRFFTILESPVWKDETTGLAFSPDKMHLYVAYQANGLLFDVTRTDGLPFDGRSINAKFHAMAEVDENGDGGQ